MYHHPIHCFFLQDLVSVKTLESFSQVECDEIHGEGNVPAAQVDDFTVETSLEDLEFGFSIIKSTQKVCVYVAYVCVQWNLRIMNTLETQHFVLCREVVLDFGGYFA